jgi:hypothetical protein
VGNTLDLLCFEQTPQSRWLLPFSCASRTLRSERTARYVTYTNDWHGTSHSLPLSAAQKTARTLKEPVASGQSNLSPTLPVISASDRRSIARSCRLAARAALVLTLRRLAAGRRTVFRPPGSSVCRTAWSQPAPASGS